MIISHILGGLGNQLFQYAAGRTLSLHHGVPLKLDITDHRHYTLRKFELEQLHTSIEIATTDEIAALKPQGAVAKALEYLRPKSKRTYHRERSFHFDKSFHRCGPDVYLKGYFQSEDYFAPIAPVIRKEFRLQPGLIKEVEVLGNQLRQETSIAVHIRRGDYTNPEVIKVHGILPIAYYQQAIAIMTDRFPDARFYFFSDDIDWVKNNLQPERAEYISGVQSHTHFEDFYLMSCCRHQVIANSSFSWWTAWLNDYPQKMVIAPQQWFTDPLRNADRTPPGWLRI